MISPSGRVVEFGRHAGLRCQCRKAWGFESPPDHFVDNLHGLSYVYSSLMTTSANEYELVAGIETHVQLQTRTKMFCSCSAQFGAPPNTQVCPVCLGLPGALPVLNEQALMLALRAALALNGRIASFTKFDRKNYFYPDLPKNYQISQYDLPLATDGWVEAELKSGERRRIRIQRVHMEEDAGKLIHEQNGDRSFVDLNRAGVPLIEIVTYPDIRSADEAEAYLRTLRQILRYAGVSDCDMEKGELRCDLNVSVRPRGSGQLGTKTEVKNVNSFKFAADAIRYEYRRQVEELTRGGTVRQETRLYDPERGVTRVMRSKEEVHDYRYFPEPDLPPLRISHEMIEQVRKLMPELPQQRKERFMRAYGLSDYDATVLVSERETAEYFEECLKVLNKPKVVANWITGAVAQIMNEQKKTLPQLALSPAELVAIIEMVESGRVTNLSGKEALAEMIRTGKTARQVVQEKGLEKVSDDAVLEKAVDEAIANNPKAVADFKAGKQAAEKFFFGQVMKATKGRADIDRVKEILKRKLSS